MKLLATFAALAVVAGALAQETAPTTFSYSWSLSGEKYMLATIPAQNDFLSVKNLNFGMAAGLNSRNIPTYGLGLTYTFVADKASLGLGAYVLSRQNTSYASADFALGATLTFKF